MFSPQPEPLFVSESVSVDDIVTLFEFTTRWRIRKDLDPSKAKAAVFVFFSFCVVGVTSHRWPSVLFPLGYSPNTEWILIEAKKRNNESGDLTKLKKFCANLPLKYCEFISTKHKFGGIVACEHRLPPKCVRPLERGAGRYIAKIVHHYRTICTPGNVKKEFSLCKQIRPNTPSLPTDSPNPM